MTLSLDEANRIAQVAIDKAEVLGNNISCGLDRLWPAQRQPDRAGG